MAKATAKTSSTPAKKASPSKTKAKTSTTVSIEKVSAEALKTLESLGIEAQLQADLTWCLGSYSHDKNPVGLYEMVERSVDVLKKEQAKKTKGVTAKLVSDLEKALSSK